MTKRLFLAGAALLLLAATGPARADDGPTCGQLLLSRCEQCHYISRVCQKLGKKSKWRWKRSIRAMVRHGAVLSKAEQRQLVDCLYRQTEDVKQACTDPDAVKPYGLLVPGAKTGNKTGTSK